MHSSQRGITLIETLVALLIMSVTMLAILTLFTQSIAGRRADLQSLQTARELADEGETTAMRSTADWHHGVAP